MYHMSYFTLSLISIKLRISPRNPFIWLQPVIPGFTVWRIINPSIMRENSSVCFTMCGRGPTTLISPSRTFMNWGVSSMFVIRNICPQRVIILCSLKAVGIFVLPHCTELVATENPAFQTGSLLNEERISRHCAFGYDNYNYQYHRKQGT